MSKTRVTGEQIKVILWERNRKAPLIIDFDTFDVSKSIESREYRGIGKTYTSNQTISKKYDISLSRNKRDNYLTTLINLVDSYQFNNLETPEFAIERVITYTYPASSINPKEEFQQRNNPFLNVLSVVSQFGSNQINSAIQNNIVAKEAINANTKALNALSFIANALLKEDRFIERELYVGCKLINYLASDKHGTNTTEQATFFSTHLINDTDKNDYVSYISQLIATGYIERDEETKNILKQIIDNTTIPVVSDNVQRLIKSVF